jgi:predicted cupin superfamily sugar epimerase
MTADEVIRLLDLKPLAIEGGYYRETYRAEEVLPAGVWPTRYGRDKAIATAIYFLLTPDTFSALHRLPTDEIYHFYLGDPVELLELLADGSGRLTTLGSDLAAGHQPQWCVPRGVWQGSCLADGGRFALLGTTMAPGFDFTDFEAANRDQLLARYPLFADRIRRLTRT